MQVAMHAHGKGFTISLMKTSLNTQKPTFGLLREKVYATLQVFP